MTATRWHWVRHGPTHQKTFVGWRDVPADLTDTAAIGRLAAHLPAGAVVVSSDLIRAFDTARAITATTVEPARFRDLREFNFGLWDGLHFSDVADRDPDLSRRYWEDPGDVAAPEGESWNIASARVDTVVTDLTRLYEGRDIIAVAHFGVILTQVQRALGVTAYEALAHHIAPLSVTRIDIAKDGARQVRGINFIA